MYGNNEGTVGGFTIHVVAASVWPTYLLSATAYSNLRLPEGLADVAKEFDILFTQRSCCVHNFQLDRSNSNQIDENDVIDGQFEDWYGSSGRLLSDPSSSTSLVSVYVEGATGVHSSANGEYTRTLESKGKYVEPIYTKKSTGKWIIVFCRAQMIWQLKKRQGLRDRDTFLQIAYCRANSNNNNNNNNNSSNKVSNESSLPSLMTMTEGQEGMDIPNPPLESLCWKEYHLANKTWINSSIRLTARTAAATTPSSSSPRLHEDASHPDNNNHQHRTIDEPPSLSTVAAWVLSDHVPVPSTKNRSRSLTHPLNINTPYY